MDRISNLKFYVGLSVVGLCLAVSAYAGVRFVSEEKEPSLKPGESYAESRFGEPPAQLELKASSARMISRAPAESPEGENFGESRPRHKASNPAFPDEVMETAPSVVARQGVQEVALIAGDLGFFPKTIFLTRDVPVRFYVTGASKNALCIIMDSFQVRRQVRPQKVEEISFTPHTPGKYRFYCPVNGMEGAMVVREYVSRLAAD
jgi:plastocyanin